MYQNAVGNEAPDRKERRRLSKNESKAEAFRGRQKYTLVEASVTSIIDRWSVDALPRPAVNCFMNATPRMAYHGNTYPRVLGKDETGICSVGGVRWT